MRTIASLRLSLLAVTLSCGHLSAQIEGLFAGIEPGEPRNGLILEIAVPKQTYFSFEPVAVFARFRNVADQAIALVPEERSRAGIASKLSWESSPVTGDPHAPNTAGSTLHNLLLIPSHGTVYFALPDCMFSVGTTNVRIRYRHSQSYEQPSLAGADVWQGTVNSNELVIAVQDKQRLTEEERALVENKIRRHIEAFKNEDAMTRYLAAGHVVRLAKYSVRPLLNSLKHENALVRVGAIDALARIADKGIAKTVGFERDVSFLDDLLRAYDRERETAIREKLVYALVAFKDVDEEKRARIVQTLRKAVNSREKSLRLAGGCVLLRVSRKNGIPEVIDRIGDDAYFGDEGQRIVLRMLQEETGQSFGPSSQQWRKWWRENRGKVTDK